MAESFRIQSVKYYHSSCLTAPCFDADKMSPQMSKGSFSVHFKSSVKIFTIEIEIFTLIIK